MEQTTRRKISYSGIQPSGVIHLANYIGALRNWVALQEEYDCFYCIVDMHAITVRQDPRDLRENTIAAYAMGVACGIDPVKSIFYIQSHAPAHGELAWVLNCYTPFGELGRMTQFKEKSETHADNINAGLFTYPVLQAADILLYDSDVVPVGEDQKQHLELSRNIAVRFNGIYGDVFRVPEPFISKSGARIMSLADPAKKMSKSDPNPRSYISMLDPRDTVIKKFKSAVTDSESEVCFREGKDGINNLMIIYGVVAGKTNNEIEREFAGRGYGDFKMAVGESVADFLSPIQEKYHGLMADRAYIEGCWKSGGERARAISNRTMATVLEKVGMVRR
ncbi:MAG: tryptophan--tRNA ligase [Oscillospiraceae bacterium]|nr:tryptophan--tRNA ligase [Oscillospiraceae bacterium]